MGSSMSLSIIGGLWDKIRAFFDIIPKVIYFLYAALSSGVDAMQALVRKLAGLDVYYVGGSEVAQTDPLSEFVYGILGIGGNKVMYQALNTVFWSLVVFAVIILAISTIIAIIKSHYNEDTNGTSPWKYIYQAIKAIFTFALIPFVTLLGMKLATFTLNSLDQIIAGGGNEDAVTAMYGPSAAAKFKSTEIKKDSGVYYYVNYDYFGYGNPTTSTTFSGMLFKASANSANRVRIGSLKLNNVRQVKNDGAQIFGASDCNDFSTLTNDDDKREYIAYQIDYAFANCLKMEKPFNYSEVIDTTDDALVVSAADIFGYGKSNISTFSKFDVSFVWLFYNLWSFNFIIAFAGVFSVFAIMISIILGLMTRLLYGAALFLIYPTLLGLAPMDNFKAFKSWGTTFMGQILMAIGSIVGINLTLLIIPYVQTIKFFNIFIIDQIINLIILIAGLMMAKDIINLVSGFVGSNANAMAAGDSKKGAVAGALKQGAGMTAKVGLGTARVMGATVTSVGRGAGRVVLAGTATFRANRRAKKTRGLETDAVEAAGLLTDNENAKKVAMDAAVRNNSKLAETATTAYNDTYNDYIKAHKTKDMDAAEQAKMKAEAEKEAEKARYSAVEKQVKDKGYDSFGADGARLQKAFDDYDSAKASSDRKAMDASAARDKVDAIVKRYNLKVKDDGKYRFATEAEEKQLKQMKKDQGETAGEKAKMVGLDIWEGFKKSIDSVSIGKSIADAFNKSVSEVGKNTGIDKLVAASKDVLKGNFSWKGGAFDGKKDKATGDDLARQNAAEQQKQSEKTNKTLEELLKVTKNQNKEKSNSTTSGSDKK